MGQSWHGLKKKLENDFLCESLRGRVSYFITTYRKSHDGAFSRFSVSIDGKEVIKGNNDGWMKAESKENKDARLRDGKFYTFDFTKGRNYYLENSIGDSIESDDYFVRLFAILDRRIGKRTLASLVSQVEKQPHWLQQFYRLRLESEHIL